jgi:hypothetical protein
MERQVACWSVRRWYVDDAVEDPGAETMPVT